MLKYIAFVDVSDSFSFFEAPNPSRFENVERGGEFTLFAYLSILLVVLTHSKICKRLSLRIG